MPQRSTDSLDVPPPEEATPSTLARPGAPANTNQPPKLVSALVELNYPDPTPLSMIVRDVARWSGRNFVMEPSLACKLQIFAPRRLTQGEAYDLFLSSLSVVGLRAVQIGNMVKIVPVTGVVAA